MKVYLHVYRSIKVTGSSHMEKIMIYFFQVVIPLLMWLQVINKVKVIHQGQIKVKVTCKESFSYTGGLHLTQMRSCF